MASNNTRADVKVGDGFTKEHEAEAPEEIPLTGPFAGENPGSPGMPEDFGDGRPDPCDCGDGAGPDANVGSFSTDVGGATRGGNSCSPAASFKTCLELRRHL